MLAKVAAVEAAKADATLMNRAALVKVRKELATNKTVLVKAQNELTIQLIEMNRHGRFGRIRLRDILISTRQYATLSCAMGTSSNSPPAPKKGIIEVQHPGRLEKGGLGEILLTLRVNPSFKRTAELDTLVSG